MGGVGGKRGLAGTGAPLTRSEAAIAHYLQAEGRWCEPSEIVEHALGVTPIGRIADAAMLRVHVSNLRLKAGDDAVLTWRGRGYAWGDAIPPPQRARAMARFDGRWCWGETAFGMAEELRGRRGQPVTVVCRAGNPRMGRVMVRFADGYETVAPTAAVSETMASACTRARGVR